MGNGFRLSVPHSRNTKLRIMRTDTRPDLAPSLHGLLAKLTSVGDPEHAADKTIVPHRFDDPLNGDARLARSGRHADHAAARCIVRMITVEHFAQVADNNLLIAMEIREPISAFNLKKRFEAMASVSGPFGGRNLATART